ncbi:MAG: hypothetical protein B7X57_03265 [Erythrobacter sp. 34-65-8]|nr:MAG: hypothetical protein B7X57_03265 [Erythrobacter sp. 34-65-8]
MNPRVTLHRATLLAALLALPGALGGCVAAAIPAIAASGILVRDRQDTDPASANAQAPADPVVAVIAGEPAPTVVTIPPPPAPRSTVAAARSARPAAVAANTSASATGSVFAAEPVNPYAAFYLHAAEQARLDPVDAPRRSAVLARPGSLEPVMSECAILPPAVLVDLDPAGGKLDTASAIPANPNLAEVLAELRLQDVAVFWASEVPAIEAGRVREQLLASGLDPWGRDGLLLMRRAEDRKDARRRELAQTHCVVAIAGDSRGDFDELFDFLRNPAAAAPLESLFGEGWFLTPTLVAAPDAAKED